MGDDEDDDGGGDDEVGGNSDDGVDVPPLHVSEYRPTHELVISVNDPADTSKALSSNLSTSTLLSRFLSCKCKERKRPEQSTCHDLDVEIGSTIRTDGRPDLKQPSFCFYGKQ